MKTSISLCSLLLLFSSFFHSAAAEGEENNNLVPTIVDNIQVAKKFGFTLPWMDLALSRASYYKTLQTAFDTFFANSAGGDCRAQPSELLSTYFLTISENDLAEFLKEDFVKELPVKVQNQLKLLKYNKQDIVMSDTFSKIRDVTRGEGSEAGSGEGLEVGHVMFKASFDSDTGNFRILLLVPSVKNTLKIGCVFDNEFRNQFIGRSQDIQNLLAIKAAENRGFVNTLAAFSNAEAVATLGFEQVETKTGILLKKTTQLDNTR